jgi:hypothetical protein
VAGNTPMNEKINIFDTVLKLSENLMSDPSTFGRVELKKHLKLYYGFPITHTAATEGMFVARGELLENGGKFNRTKMVEWMARRVPDLIDAYKATQRGLQERSVFIDTDKQIDGKNSTLAGKARFFNADDIRETEIES